MNEDITEYSFSNAYLPDGIFDIDEESLRGTRICLKRDIMLRGSDFVREKIFLVARDLSPKLRGIVSQFYGLMHRPIKGQTFVMEGAAIGLYVLNRSLEDKIAYNKLIISKPTIGKRESVNSLEEMKKDIIKNVNLPENDKIRYVNLIERVQDYLSVIGTEVKLLRKKAKEEK
jgi:hypothetical protein